MERSTSKDDLSIASGSLFRGANDDTHVPSVNESPAMLAIVLGKTPEIKVPFNKPCIFPECMKAVQNAFDAGKVSGDGLNTQLCTEFFDGRFGYKNSLFTPSCTAALEMAALILEVGEGDEVICPSFTFVSTANAFALRGVTLVFADSEKETPNMDVNDVLDKITDKTKAILVVHYAGVPIDLTKLVATGIPIVEDCAHAIGSIDPVTNDFVGKTGCLATFSYHETKNVSIGEGGTLVVNDRALWDKAHICREKGTNRTAFREGREAFYTWLSLGSSYLMSDVDAGVLWGCFQHYGEIQAKRVELWEYYHDNLWSSSLFQKPNQKISKANAHMYYLQFENLGMRKTFEKAMKSQGILVTSHYKPLDGSPFIQAQNKELGREQPPCVHSQRWSDTLIRLPLYFELDKLKIDRVVEAVNAFTLQNGGMALVPCTFQYYEAVRSIRNEHRFSFQTTDMIAVGPHQAFMDKHAKTYRIAVNDAEQVIGFVGHVKGDFRLATATSLMRKGVGQFMWESFHREFPDITVQVLRDNGKSMSFFKKQGFEPDPDEWKAGADPVSLVPAKVE